jgi:hypothetical protein
MRWPESSRIDPTIAARDGKTVGLSACSGQLLYKYLSTLGTGSDGDRPGGGEGSTYINVGFCSNYSRNEPVSPAVRAETLSASPAPFRVRTCSYRDRRFLTEPSAERWARSRRSTRGCRSPTMDVRTTVAYSYSFTA